MGYKYEGSTGFTPTILCKWTYGQLLACWDSNFWRLVCKIKQLLESLWQVMPKECHCFIFSHFVAFWFGVTVCLWLNWAVCPFLVIITWWAEIAGLLAVVNHCFVLVAEPGLFPVLAFDTARSIGTWFAYGGRGALFVLFHSLPNVFAAVTLTKKILLTISWNAVGPASWKRKSQCYDNERTIFFVEIVYYTFRLLCSKFDTHQKNLQKHIILPVGLS